KALLLPPRLPCRRFRRSRCQSRRSSKRPSFPPHSARTRDPPTPRRRQEQQGGRQPPRHQRQHRRSSSRQHHAQARSPLPPRTRPLRHPQQNHHHLTFSPNSVAQSLLSVLLPRSSLGFWVPQVPVLHLGPGFLLSVAQSLLSVLLPRSSLGFWVPQVPVLHLGPGFLFSVAQSLLLTLSSEGTVLLGFFPPLFTIAPLLLDAFFSFACLLRNESLFPLQRRRRETC